MPQCGFLYTSLAELMPLLRAALAALYASMSPDLYTISLALISDFSFAVIQGFWFGATRTCFEDVTVSTQRLM